MAVLQMENGPLDLFCAEDRSLCEYRGWLQFSVAWPLLATGAFMTVLFMRGRHFAPIWCLAASFVEAFLATSCLTFAGLRLVPVTFVTQEQLSARLLMINLIPAALGCLLGLAAFTLVPPWHPQRRYFCRLFASLRFNDYPLSQAEEVRLALQKHDLELVIARPPLGQLIQDFVFGERCLGTCDAFVAFACADYAADTGNPASTYYELQWWEANRGHRPLPFVIDMRAEGEEFRHDRAKALVQQNVMRHIWRGEPEGLEEVVRAIIDGVRGMGHKEGCPRKRGKKKKCTCGLKRYNILRAGQKSASRGGKANAKVRRDRR